jgi:DNA polymerase elongation subunit (family B)
LVDGFWTNVAVVGNKIGLRCIERGVRVKKLVPYTPTVYMVSPEPTKYQSFDERFYLTPIQPGNIWETKKWLKDKQEITGFMAFGNPRAEYAFLTDNYPFEVPFDTKLIYVANIDIEVDSSNGFPQPEAAAETVLSITIERDGHYHVWGMKEFKPHIPNITYTQCADELELLASFLNFWTSDYPDVVTGWNISKFDIPYLLHRITKIMGADRAKSLSPWGRLTQRTITQFNRQHLVYSLSGLDILDYMDLFKKFSRNAAQESYTLGDIAFEIAKEAKLDYGNRSLADLYRDDFQTYIEYNIHDTTLIRKIDQKEKLLELAFVLAYQSHTNPSDVFSQVRMWTQIIDDFLARENKFSTAFRYSDIEKERFEGAHVKDSFSGMFDWVASFDATSLYPSLIMQHNISPDTFIEPTRYTPEMKQLMDQRIDVDTLYNRQVKLDLLKSIPATLTANKQLFRTDKHGFLPRIIEDLFSRRQAAKKRMIEAEKAVEALKDDPASDPQTVLQAQNNAARYDTLQNAIKTCLNSSFGALGNNFFFHFDVRLAEAITLTGQLTIQWATRAVNEYMNSTLKTDDDYVIAGDTDSLYLHLGGILEAVFDGKPPTVTDGIDFMDKLCKGPLAHRLDRDFAELSDSLQVLKKKIHFKRESLADRAVWSGGKKRYIVNVWDQEGVRYHEPKIKIKGFEMVKSSTPKICRDTMKAAVKIIINKTEEDMWGFIADFRRKFMQLPIETIAFPRGCNDMEKYKGQREIYKLGCPQNVKAALLYNDLLTKRGLTNKYPMIRSGDKIRFVKLKQPNILHDDVVGFPYVLPEELGLHEYIDYEEMFDKTFIEPLKIILDSIGWKVKKEVSLKSLFTLTR